MNITKLCLDIGARPVSGRNVPDELKPFCCYDPSGGYCIFCVPEMFTEYGEKNPEEYCIPLPEKYVLEKGWRFLSSGIPCVEVPYNRETGAHVDESYETWR